ncbi:MAG: hypothetical protein R3D58_17300 [Saprospiraceae bacterium]
MNKKIILGALVVLGGFITLTAFGGKTLEQQKQEIAAEITAQLDEFRAQKQEECTMRINEEAQRRYTEYVASLPAPTTAKPGSGTKTKPRTKPTVKDPLPQTPTDPTQARPGGIKRSTDPDELTKQQMERSGGVKRSDDVEKTTEEQKKRPGGVKREGGK